MASTEPSSGNGNGKGSSHVSLRDYLMTRRPNTAVTKELAASHAPAASAAAAAVAPPPSAAAPAPATPAGATAPPAVSAAPPHAEPQPARSRSGLSKDAESSRYRLFDRLMKEMESSRLLSSLASPPDARRAVEDAVGQLIDEEGLTLSRPEKLTLMREIADEVVGYGPIQPLLDDDSVTEVMVNARDHIFFERKGLLARYDRDFRDDEHVIRVIERIVQPLGRRIDESSPMVDARLPDGSRVNAIIPPLAIKGPSITIRKFSKHRLTDEDLIRFGAITPDMAAFLRAAVGSKQNIVVSGGTGSGKTTFLNVLSSYIPGRERLVTIEDPAELQLTHENWVALETRPPNVEGKGMVQQRDLVKNALRMRPDRIIVGECRGGEAFDMLQAMNTGHDGSLTTIHANTPRDALSRIENMVLMANLDLPVRAIRDQIASAINMVVQLSRLSDGSRRVTYVTEVVGTEGDVITMQDIFVFRREGVDAEGKVIGRLTPTGIRPNCAEKIERSGFHLPPEFFTPVP